MPDQTQTEIEQPPQSPISRYNPLLAGLEKLREEVSNTVFDLATRDGEKMGREARRKCVMLRTDTEKLRKSLNEDAQAHIKSVNGVAKSLTASILEIETPLDERIKAKEEAERKVVEDRRLAEERRKEALRARVAYINGYAGAIYRSSAEVATAIDRLRAIIVDASFEEFAKEATDARENGIAALLVIHNERLEAEAEDRRIKEERAQLDRDKAESDRRIREAQEAWEKQKAEEELKAKAELDRLNALRARIKLIRRAGNVDKNATLEQLQHQFDEVSATKIDESFAEFQQAAADELALSLDAIGQAIIGLKERVAEAERKAAAEALAKTDQRDQERKALIRQWIDAIFNLPMKAVTLKDSAAIEAKMKELEEVVITDSFGEFKAQAEEVKAKSLQTFGEMIVIAVGRETEAARVAKEQEEATRRQQQADFEREQMAIADAQDRDELEARLAAACGETEVDPSEFVGGYLMDPEASGDGWFIRSPGGVQLQSDEQLLAELNRLDVLNQEMAALLSRIRCDGGTDASLGGDMEDEIDAVLAKVNA